MAGHVSSMFFLSTRPCAPEVHGEAPLLRRAPPAQARASSQSSSASPASSSSCEAATVACSWGAATAAPQEPLPQLLSLALLQHELRCVSVAPEPCSFAPCSRTFCRFSFLPSAAAAVRFVLVSQDSQQSSQSNSPRRHSTTIGCTVCTHLRPPSRAAGPQDVHVHGIHLAGPCHQSGRYGGSSVRVRTPMSQRQSQAATAACGAEAAEVAMASAEAAEVARPPPREAVSSARAQMPPVGEDGSATSSSSSSSSSSPSSSSSSSSPSSSSSSSSSPSSPFSLSLSLSLSLLLLQLLLPRTAAPEIWG